MKLYVVRHGQTDWNIQARLQGHIDTQLNETGRMQAETLAQKMKNIHFDLIISSPLTRALDTAKTINKNKNLQIIINNSLIERGFGNFEGSDDLSKYNCNINMLLNYELNYSKHNVEPIQNLFERVKSFLNYCSNNFPTKSILLVTHAGVAQAIECILNNLPPTTNLQSLSLGNCEYRIYTK